MPRSLALQPLHYGMAYLGLSILLFLFGPMRYPPDNIGWLLAYLATAFALIWVGYSFGVRRPAPETIDSRWNWRAMFLFGSVLSVVMLFPMAWAYTGKMPWEVMEAVQNQNSAYLAMQEQVTVGAGDREWIIILRTLTQPFAYAAIPLGVIYWRKLRLVYRALLAAAVLSTLTFSVLRGTDREVADLAVIIFAAFMVGRTRYRLAGERRARLPWRKILAAVFGIVVILGAYTAFSERKSERMGTIGAFCMANSGACADYNNPMISMLSDQGKFSVAMASTYFTNGYHGLALALQKPFEPAWGLGHSPALARVYSTLTGDTRADYRTYNYRNVDEGWPMEFFWSSMLTSLANDISFPGALVAVALFGALWSRAWIGATVGRNDAAAVLFCLTLQTILYFPANLQVLLTLDGYSTVVFWLVLWNWTSRRARRGSGKSDVPAYSAARMNAPSARGY